MCTQEVNKNKKKRKKKRKQQQKNNKTMSSGKRNERVKLKLLEDPVFLHFQARLEAYLWSNNYILGEEEDRFRCTYLFWRAAKMFIKNYLKTLHTLNVDLRKRPQQDLATTKIHANDRYHVSRLMKDYNLHNTANRNRVFVTSFTSRKKKREEII